MADYSELKRKAQEIKDEVKAGANTANRVGLALEETVKALEAENQRAEQAEESLENSVQMLQDETEDLQSIRDDVERLGSDKADKSALEATNKEVSKKQNKLDNYKEDPSNGSVEIFAQDKVSVRNDSQGGVSCVEVYNEEDTEGIIPVARMSADKENGDYASVTVRGNEVHIEGDGVKVNGEDLESFRTTVVNDLTTGGADKALSAEMGKVLGMSVEELEERVHDLGDFGRSSQAEAEAGKADIAGNPGIVLIRYTVGNKNGIILQQVGETITNQILFWDSVYQRHINFSGSDKTSVSSTSYWYKIGATHTSYDAETRRLHLQDMNYSNLNPSIDAVLPLASEAEAGLMSKEQVAKLRGAASNADLANKQGKLKTYSETSDGKNVNVVTTSSVMMEASPESKTTYARVLISANDYGVDYTAMVGRSGLGDPTSLSLGYNNIELRTGGDIVMKSAQGAVYDVVGAIVSRKSDDVELLENGNIKLTLKGTTKEFMPATPSGDPLHYAYEAAGAEYNATDDFIVKDAPWKDMVDTIEDKAKWGFDVVDASEVKQMTIGNTTYNYVQTTRQSPEGTTEPRYYLVGQASDGTWVEDETKVLHLPGHWYLNGLGDITDLEMKKVWYTPHNAMYIAAYASSFIRTPLVEGNGSDTSVNLNGWISSSQIESVVVSQTIYPNSTSRATFNNKKLRYIIQSKDKYQHIYSYVGYDIPARTFRAGMFFALKKPLSFTSFIISKPSILYAINNAVPTTPITITLHADRYAQLSDDADIRAALDAKNTSLEGTGGSVSLVSA